MKARLFDRQREPLNTGEQAALTEVERRFSAAPMYAPASGFGRRWLARIHCEQEHRQRVRASWLAIANGAAAILIFALIFSGAFSRPIAFMTSLIDDLLAFFSLVQAAILVFLSVFQALPVLAWFPFFSALLLLTGLWAFLFQRPVYVEGENR